METVRLPRQSLEGICTYWNLLWAHSVQSCQNMNRGSTCFIATGLSHSAMMQSSSERSSRYVLARALSHEVHSVGLPYSRRICWCEGTGVRWLGILGLSCIACPGHALRPVSPVLSSEVVGFPRRGRIPLVFCRTPEEYGTAQLVLRLLDCSQCQIRR